jgi:hypothetical protein
MLHDKVDLAGQEIYRQVRSCISQSSICWIVAVLILFIEISMWASNEPLWKECIVVAILPLSGFVLALIAISIATDRSDGHIGSHLMTFAYANAFIPPIVFVMSLPIVILANPSCWLLAVLSWLLAAILLFSSFVIPFFIAGGEGP